MNYNQEDYVYHHVIYGVPWNSKLRKSPDENLRKYMGENTRRVSGETGTAYYKKFLEEVVHGKDSVYKDSLIGNINLQWPDINTMNIFTAADLTQCCFDVLYDLDCPIKKFYITFDIPTMLSQTPYGIRPLDSYSYVIDNPDVLSNMKKGSLLLHFQFPTLSNLQLIRSLVLTSLLTAFFSLFCLNAFYLFRKHNNILPQGKKWTRFYRIMIIIAVVLLLLLVYLLLDDKSIPIYKTFEFAKPQ